MDTRSPGYGFEAVCDCPLFNMQLVAGALQILLMLGQGKSTHQTSERQSDRPRARLSPAGQVRSLEPRLNTISGHGSCLLPAIDATEDVAIARH